MRSGRVVLMTWMLGAGAASGDDCRAIEDDADRLACYDRLATPEEESTAPQAAAVSADAGGEARTQAGTEEAEVARPGPLRRVFGAIKLPKPEPVNVVASGKIVRVRELARGNFELELDSGEVWRENERELRTNYRIGDMVVISSGMLGTFNLDNERSGQRTKARKVR
ncbi:MAG: hypothetical protein OXI55_06795 [Gammaproteobacteria bacterium]|nr:hypothetical protein [Gammaproteobacteria bacterium]